ncbi:hypothetical protein OQA88_3460 [Cercophora sp. LCS_1]
MAIIHGIRGLKVSVRVNGTLAREYPAPNEVVPDDLDFDVPEDEDGPQPYVVKYIEAVPGDSNFSKDAIQEQISQAKDIGVIRVNVFHMKASNVVARELYRTTTHKTATLAEKALKGKAVDAQLGLDTKPFGSTTIYRNEDIFHDSQKRPFAVFDFWYRTKEGLYKEGILERPRTPDQIDAMNEDGLRRLARELLEKQATGETRVKSENGDGRAVKRERAETMSDAEFLRRYKGRKMEGGKIEIDLTDD